MNEFLGGSIVWFWTTILLHFVWQGTLIAAVAALILLASGRNESTKRYWILVAGLGCLVISPLATGVLMWSSASASHGNVDAGELQSVALESTELDVLMPQQNVVVSGTPVVAPPSQFGVFELGELTDRGEQIESVLRALAFAVWFVAQVLLGGRLLIGGVIMWRIRRTAEDASDRVLAIGMKLKAKLGLNKVPRILVTHRINDAATVGFFRSVVILPGAWIRQMSPEMLEAILAHEFAHVRRHDVWVNLLQRIIETMFFYHPAVWWLSAQIRIEREHCCDSSAVSATGDCNTFAKTLELAARQRAGIEFGLVTNLGGKRMSLLHRINRVLGQPQRDNGGTRWPLGLVTLLVPVLMAIHGRQVTTVAADPQTEKVIQFNEIQVFPTPSGNAQNSPTAVGGIVAEAPAVVGSPARFPAPAIGVPADITTNEPPTELTKVTLPDYVIEPPDILQIEGIKLTPKGPLRIETEDVLQIVVKGTLPQSPIAGQYIVEPHGQTNLGSAYGSVEVVGLTTDEANAAIVKRLRKFIKNPEVSIAISRRSGQQLVSGEHLVAPDGTVNLGVYGRVFLSGKTVPQAREAVEEHLSRFFTKPRISLDVFVYNSKFYYIIVEGREDLGDQVVRMPVSGNETVLDAIAQIGGLEATQRKVWISRPASNGKDVMLSVDF